MPAIHIPQDKPIVATTYNKYMGGVDLNDMMTSTYDEVYLVSTKHGRRSHFIQNKIYLLLEITTPLIVYI
jgi:hypothetical protein